ncbi:hypothetical protein BPTFM16_02847 [Altererythrobacter insulae]|nr:hypothetical protein BPTFM16_02847 [Altererythrobacter insulae]
MPNSGVIMADIDKYFSDDGGVTVNRDTGA